MLTKEMIDRQLALEMESVQIGIASYQKALMNARTKGGVESMAPEAKAIQMYMNPFLRGEGKSDGLLTTLKGTGAKAVRKDAILRKYLKVISVIYNTKAH